MLDLLVTKLLTGEFKPGYKIKVTAKDDEPLFEEITASYCCGLSR